jgi:hypothetical protein
MRPAAILDHRSRPPTVYRGCDGRPNQDIDNRRIASEPLAVITSRKLVEMEEYLEIVLGMSG